MLGATVDDPATQEHDQALGAKFRETHSFTISGEAWEKGTLLWFGCPMPGDVIVILNQPSDIAGRPPVRLVGLCIGIACHGISHAIAAG